MLRSKGPRPSLIFVVLIAFVALSIFAVGQQKPVDPTAKADAATTVAPVDAKAAPPAPPAEVVSAIRIGNGDLIELSVFGVNDFKQDLRVNNAGDVSIPLLG